MTSQKKKSTQLKSKPLIVNDLVSLQKEFYKTYDPDYWLHKISLLKNCHDNFENAKEILTINMGGVDDEEYKRVLRTEMHFLYFQMVETLFEIIFAVAKHDNKNLGLALTFSNYKQSDFYSNTYKQITELSDVSDIFTKKKKTEIKGEKQEISLLRWIFYFVYPSKITDDEWRNNLNKIRRLLLLFAKDFSDRGEYNAYKHSLRFYNSSFGLSIGKTSGEKMFSLMQSDDSITYLEEKNGAVRKTTKTFDFEKDTKRCLIIYHMIKNIIYTRKYSILPDLSGEKFDFYTFFDIDIKKLHNVGKSSFIV